MLITIVPSFRLDRRKFLRLAKIRIRFQNIRQERKLVSEICYTLGRNRYSNFCILLLLNTMLPGFSVPFYSADNGEIPYYVLLLNRFNCASYSA